MAMVMTRSLRFVKKRWLLNGLFPDAEHVSELKRASMWFRGTLADGLDGSFRVTLAMDDCNCRAR